MTSQWFLIFVSCRNSFRKCTRNLCKGRRPCGNWTLDLGLWAYALTTGPLEPPVITLPSPYECSIGWYGCHFSLSVGCIVIIWCRRLLLATRAVFSSIICHNYNIFLSLVLWCHSPSNQQRTIHRYHIHNNSSSALILFLISNFGGQEPQPPRLFKRNKTKEEHSP